MARRTNEEIIIDLIIREKGVSESINNLNSFDTKVKATVGWLQQLAQESNKSIEQVISAMQELNKSVQVVDPAVLAAAGPQAIADASKAAHAERMQQLKEEEAAERAKTTQVKSGIAEINAAEKVASAERKARLAQEQGIIDANFDKYKSKINEILRLTPPANQIRPLAQLAIDMERIDKIPLGETLKKLSREFGLTNQQVRAVSNEIHYLRNGFMGMAKESINLGSIINTAFGVGTAMLIFNVVQAVMSLVTWFGKAIEASNELSKNILKLKAAEASLSQAGGEITPKDFEAIINRLDEKFVLTPRIDIISGLKKLSLDTAALGYGAKQIEELMNAAMLIAIKNPDKSLESIIEAMTTPLFGGSYKGAQGLNIRLNDETVKAKAKELGLWNELEGAISASAKQAAIYALIVEQTLGQEKELLEAQNALVFAGDRWNAVWKEFTEVFGGLFAPMWNVFVSTMAENISSATEELKKLQSFVNQFLPYLLATIELITSKEIAEELVANFSPENLANKLNELVQKYAKELRDAEFGGADTPTGQKISPDANEFEGNTSKITKQIQSLIEWLDSLGDRARKMADDFSRATQQLVSDFENIKIPRFMEDWERARRRIIEDANRQIEKKNKEHYDREYWEYLKFQEKLRQLREKYIFNLEDALRERDARAVLKLGAQYQMDVTNATNAYELAKAEREARRQEDEAAAQAELADKLARLDEERALELKRMKEDFDLKMKRREEDHKIAMQRLQEEIDEKLEKVADALAEELGLNEEGAKALYDGLKQYYGGKGLIDNLWFYTYQNLKNTTKSTYDFIMQYVAAYQKAAQQMEAYRKQIYGQGGGTYMPHPGLYNQSSPNTNLPTMNYGGLGTVVPSSAGSSLVKISLDEGLVGKIVDQSVDKVNDVVVQLNKEHSYV